MHDDALTDRLKARGLRVTPQRAVIFEIMRAVQGHGHLTAQEVYEQAKDRLPGLNVATVYRTLETLHDAALVDLMEARGAEVRFSLRDPANRHCHLVCRACEAVLDVELGDIERLAGRLEKETGFRLDVDHLTLGGLCKRCRTR